MNKVHYVDFETKLKRVIVMGFIEAVKTCFQKYATFSGRASRSEFWYFLLFQIFVGLATSVIFGTGSNIASNIITLALLIPNLSVSVRRLHDLNRKGWWYFPLVIGSILFFLILFAMKTASVGGDTDPLYYYFMLLFTTGTFSIYGIILLIWLCRKGTEGDNRFGPDPLQTKN